MLRIDLQTTTRQKVIWLVLSGLSGVVAMAVSILVVTVVYNALGDCEPSLEQFPGHDCVGPIGILDDFLSLGGFLGWALPEITLLCSIQILTFILIFLALNGLILLPIGMHKNMSREQRKNIWVIVALLVAVVISLLFFLFLVFTAGAASYLQFITIDQLMQLMSLMTVCMPLFCGLLILVLGIVLKYWIPFFGSIRRKEIPEPNTHHPGQDDNARA